MNSLHHYSYDRVKTFVFITIAHVFAYTTDLSLSLDEKKKENLCLAENSKNLVQLAYM